MKRIAPAAALASGGTAIMQNVPRMTTISTNVQAVDDTKAGAPLQQGSHPICKYYENDECRSHGG